MKWKNTLHRRRRRKSISSIRSKFSLPTLPGILGKFGYAKLAKIGFIAVLLFVLSGFIVFPLLALTLPPPESIVRRSGFSTKILDRNGEVLYDIGVNDERRTPVELEEIPEYLRQATVATEDKNFYRHQGFDPTGYARAVYNIIVKQQLQGGSTLTQQLVKNVLLTQDRTISRKVKEFVLSLQIENRYSKDEILNLYLNEMPYGGVTYGVQAASERYFGKDVSELNLVESAFLAGLPQRPTVYSPYSSTPTAYIARTEGVLRRMREDGYITREEEEEAASMLPDLEFEPLGASFKAPHFVQYVQEQLEERYGSGAVEQGGLVVTTSLDLELQEAAQQIVADEIAEVEDSLDIGNGAAVAMDPETGEILVMVGSKDFDAEDYDGQVNVTTSLRQPGSAIKPITYVTALNEGYTASTLFMDVPTSFPGGAGQPDYEPENYDGTYKGPIQLRYALANSINVPAVKAIALVGVRDVLQTAYDLGIESLEPTDETLSRVGLSLTLGGGEVELIELTGAYAAFMNGGFRIDPVSILRVEDHTGRVLEEIRPQKGRQVLTPEHAFIISDILSDNEARSLVFGPNSLLNIPGRQVAVKTGTTNDLRDNWAIGGTPQVVVGTWVGNNDNSPMRSVASGVSGATPIWRQIILEALDGKPAVSFEEPEGIVTASVDVVSGYRAHSGFPERTEYFVPGTEPGEDPVHLNLKLCRGEEKLATPSDIAAQNFIEREYFIFTESDPLAGPGEPNRWQEGIDEWIAGNPDPRYSPPTEYCSGINESPLNVEFTEPRDRTSDLPNEFTVKFTITSIHGIEEAWLEVDGVRVRGFTSPPYEHTVSLSDGSHTLRAVGKDREGHESERIIDIGVNTAWDTPDPTPSPSPSPSASPSE